MAVINSCLLLLRLWLFLKALTLRWRIVIEVSLVDLDLLLSSSFGRTLANDVLIISFIDNSDHTVSWFDMCVFGVWDHSILNVDLHIS